MERTVAGRVVIGTVAGDIHEIGKNLVGMLLSTSGFEVHDLGVNVAPERLSRLPASSAPTSWGCPRSSPPP